MVVDDIKERKWLREDAFSQGEIIGREGTSLEDPYVYAFDGGYKYCEDPSDSFEKILAYEFEQGYAQGRAWYFENNTECHSVSDMVVRKIREKAQYIEKARKYGREAYCNGESKTAVLDQKVYNLCPGNMNPINKLIFAAWEDGYNDAVADPKMKPCYKGVIDIMNAQFLKDLCDEDVPLSELESEDEKEALQSYKFVVKLLERTGNEHMIKCLTCPVLYTSRLSDVDKTSDIEILNCEDDCGECTEYLDTAAKWHIDVIRDFLYHRGE